MRTRVYIETTIPSFYFTLRTDPESLARMSWTRRWWSECSGAFKLVTSPAVIGELRRGTHPSVQNRIELLKGIELLDITEEVEEIVQIYIARLVMPKNPVGDALHLALASFHRVDVLLTWNCRHLANPNKTEHIRLINYELGLPMPILTTPVNYLSGDESDG
jgi:predicted nucleic acid-binding protein